MTKDEALKLALEALERCVATCFDPYSHEQAMSGSEHFVNQTITAIKEALAQPEQEPVAWVNSSELLVMKGNAYAGAKDWRVNLGLEPEEGDVGLYTTPPQRTWVGLTDKDWNRSKHNYDFQKGVDWAESILKEKNT
jgi:hypothetical protein